MLMLNLGSKILRFYDQKIPIVSRLPL